MTREVARAVAKMNQRVSNAEQLKRFALLSDEWLPDSELLSRQ